MLIPEKDAVNYICPLRSTTTRAVSCQGKKCMGWRWFDFRDNSGSKVNGYCGSAGGIRVLEICRINGIKP